jgi:AraC-like DNA-binding protein
MLELARGLVERPVTRNWQHENMGPRYRALGVTRMFTHVLAVALDPRDEPREDPVTRLVRAFDLQRRCCALAVEMGQTIAGPIGDGGAFFLTSIDGAAGPSALDRKVDAIRALLREQLGTNTSIGVSDATADGEDLPRAYDEAILSLEWALHEAQAVVFHRRRARHKSAGVRSPYRLRVLELRRAVSAGSRRASELAAVGVSREVVRRAGGAPETARAHFENVVFELLDVVEERGLDARSVRSLETAALARLNEARTVYALGTTFQAIAAELGASVRRPSPASRAARLAAARRYIDKNLHHPLTLNDAAREAGFSPRYFSTLFKQRNGRGFERYLTARRLERARDLLRTTELPVARVSRDAGFRSEIHFYGAFKRAYGITPKTCREQAAQRR